MPSGQWVTDRPDNEPWTRELPVASPILSLFVTVIIAVYLPRAERSLRFGLLLLACIAVGLSTVCSGSAGARGGQQAPEISIGKATTLCHGQLKGKQQD